MDKYNALDNIEAAKKLRQQLILEQQDLAASLDYIRYALQDDDPEQEKAIFDIESLIQAISVYLGKSE